MIESNNIPRPDELFEFQYTKAIKQLYKQFLILVEDLSSEHEIANSKLKNYINKNGGDPSLVDQVNYLDYKKQEYLRKKILDFGNDCIRSLSSDLELYELNFKKYQKNENGE